MSWTACADEMPDSDITVLVSNPAWNGEVGLGFHDGEVWRDQDGVAWSGNGDDLPPTHWMDLPEGPK